MVFHKKVVHQTQELSKEDEVPPLQFPVSETQREEEEFEDQITDVPKHEWSLWRPCKGLPLELKFVL